MSPAWALLRLASPQLPIGGYSYSQGLEMAVEQGRVRDPASAARWINDEARRRIERDLDLEEASLANRESGPAPL